MADGRGKAQFEVDCSDRPIRYRLRVSNSQRGVMFDEWNFSVEDSDILFTVAGRKRK